MTYPQEMRSKLARSTDILSGGELALLERIRARTARARGGQVQLGIGDDCALLRLRPGEDLAVTTDLSIAGRHFRLGWHPPESIGHRTLTRGLSDLAAMGARPIAAFLSLGLPRALTRSVRGEKSWLDRFLDGFLGMADAHETPLAGGDLAESPIAIADIVVTGAVRRGEALLRTGARPGDLLYVTGSLGGSAAGLAQMAQLGAAPKRRRSRAAPYEGRRIPSRLKLLLEPHLYPQPRIAQGRWLAKRLLATAAIDISDGLSTDLDHLCQESRVAAELDAAAIPIQAAANLRMALHGGEDYELLFTASAAARLPGSIEGVPVTRIGRILRRSSGKPKVTLNTAHGTRPLAAQGWEHFS